MSRKLENAKALYLSGIREGSIGEAITQFTTDLYARHGSGVAQGIEDSAAFFEPFLERNPLRDIRIVRSFVDGRYVFLHAYQSLNNGEAEWVTTDFFDTDENDTIVGHWDVISAYSPRTPSGHTSIDGPHEIADLERTEENKLLVRRLIEDVLIAGVNPHDVDRYISAEQYIQHNAAVPDGLDFFKPFVLAEDKPLIYDGIVLLVGQGNFVATLCKARWRDTPRAQVDIFRIENGLIVEHWDNAEPAPARETWLKHGKL